MAEQRFQAKYRTAQGIRGAGGIGSLRDDPMIQAHGVETRHQAPFKRLSADECPGVAGLR